MEKGDIGVILDKHCEYTYYDIRNIRNPFDEATFNTVDYGERVNFVIWSSKNEVIRLGNVQVNDETNGYYITGVNAEVGLEQKGITHLTISWIIYMLLYCDQKKSDVNICLKNGSRVKAILAESDKYIYHKFFENKNSRVTFDGACRSFNLRERDADLDEMKKMFEEEAKILSEDESVLNHESIEVTGVMDDMDSSKGNWPLRFLGR